MVKRQYLITERAHFMCPNMHFGMLMEIEKEYDKADVEATLNRMAEAHPFLKCLIAYENGLLKVYIYPQKLGMTLLFIAHHLLVDGRGLLEIAQEFANDYMGAIAPVYVEEALLESIDDLPQKSSLSGISKMLVNLANRQWEKENHAVSYEQYKRFVEEYSKKHPVEYGTYEVNDTTVAQMTQLCKTNGFSMNDLLMAHMYVQTGTEKIIIAADIRNIVSKYRKGALGNYSTAMGIHCKSKTTDVVEKAKEVHKLVQKHLKNNRKLMFVLAYYFQMTPTLLDAAAISALGGFESKAGKFVGGSMFGFRQPKSYSITNLGKVLNDNIKSIMFIPPASPATKLTLGVVTLNGMMKACSSRNEED